MASYPHAMTRAAAALDAERPAQAAAALTEALAAARADRDEVGEETALSLQNYCAWLIGDWTDMARIVGGFRRARELRVARTGRSETTGTMLAAVAPAPGRLELSRVPEPTALAGFVKVRVRAFGLNRTEKFLRDGGWPVTELSPVAPLINGIECAGEVVDSGPPLAGELPLSPGTRVLACASSLGRGVDGTHAEYVVLPRWSVVEVPNAGEHLSWRQLAALPMSFGTAAGSLAAMDCQPGDTLLVRGGTSALGLAAIALARRTMNCTVVATSRRPGSEALLRQTGADTVLIEPGIRDQVRAQFPDGVDRALECIGEPTLKETMHCVRRGGVLCQTGALGHVPGFGLRLLGEVPSSVKVTCFESDVLTGATMSSVIGPLVEAVSQGALELPLDPTEFALSQYDQALAFLDADTRRGKVVVTV